LPHLTTTWLIANFYLRQGYGYALMSVCLSFCLCAASRKKLRKYLHEIFIKVGSWPSLKLIVFWRWPSLSFRGHSRPARSLRRKIDCSAETV